MKRNLLLILICYSPSHPWLADPLQQILWLDRDISKLK
jgi:hypothetical protein